MPEHLVEKILQERTGIEGERRNVTVMFVDAKGFTPLSERIDAEQVYTLTQACNERMLAAVHRHEGTVTQFTGDGIIALFGAPIAHEDSARRAVAAALEMQESLSAYVADTGVETAFRIGLNTGPVVVGRVGDDLSMDYTAVGDTVNLAARMEQIAEPGAVFMTAATYHGASDYFECVDLGLREVKGKSEPVHVYRPVTATGARTRIDAAVARGLSPFVGRDRDLDVLKGLWDHALEGRGQIVMISGEPGIGKSRLLLEFRRTLGDGVIWREAHCVSYGEQIPYLPVIELVKNGFGINDTDDDGTIITKIDTDTALWSPGAQKMAPYLKFLLQVDPGDARIETMDPVERRAGILDALRALVLERSRIAPRVVVVEDLHWADDQSEEAFRVCADAVAASRVLMILTFRPGYMHPSAEMPNSHRIALANLDDRSRSQLAFDTLSASSLPSGLAQAITTKAEGNPLFIEEVTKALAAGVTDIDAVPNSLQDVILSRIDRLEVSARESLQLASVIGREFTLRLLNRISGLSSELEGVLTELKTLELIYEKTFFPELAYMFKHALTHDVAYSTLLIEKRKTLHRVVAGAIEELYADRLTEHYETLAYHYGLAENWTSALDYLRKSGDKAATSYANRDALSFYERALSICERLGDHAAIAEISQRRGEINIAIFALAEARSDFERMLLAGQAAEDPHVISQAQASQAVVSFFLHEFDEGEALAVTALETGGDRFEDTRFSANLALAGIYIVTARLDQGLRAYDQSRQLVEAASGPLLVWLTAEFDVLLVSWRGRFDDAITIYEGWLDRLGGPTTLASIPAGWAGAVAMGGAGQYMRAIETAGDAIAVSERIDAFPDFRARSLNTTGWIFGEIENHERAIEWNTRGLEAAREIESADREFENNALLNLGDSLMALGDLARAEEHYLEVERVVLDPQPADAWMMWRYSQHLSHSFGELALRRGEAEVALERSDRCIEVAEATESLKNVVKGRRLRGQALTTLGRLDEAGGELRRASEIARRISNPPQLWKSLAAAADLRSAEGRREDAETLYREAMSIVTTVAQGLTDDLQHEFLNSAHIADLRAKVT